MNTSSPLSSARWWLRTHSPAGTGMGTADAVAERESRRRTGRRGWVLGVLVEVLYWTLYGACRVYLFWWVMGVYEVQKRNLGLAVQGGSPMGQQPGYWLVWSVFWHLRWQCQVGTGILGAVNAWWFGRGVGKMLVREWRSLSGRGAKRVY